MEIGLYGFIKFHKEETDIRKMLALREYIK